MSSKFCHFVNLILQINKNGTWTDFCSRQMSLFWSYKICLASGWTKFDPTNYTFVHKYLFICSFVQQMNITYVHLLFVLHEQITNDKCDFVHLSICSFVPTNEQMDICYVILFICCYKWTNEQINRFTLFCIIFPY